MDFFLPNSYIASVYQAPYERGSMKDALRFIENAKEILSKSAIVDDGRDIYHELHTAGYYRGDLYTVDVVKAAMRRAEEFVKKLLS